MNFDEWFEEFSKNKNITNLSIREIAQLSFDQGIVCQKTNSPMYVKTETGEITEVPREIEDSIVLPEDWIWDESEVDLESWLKNKTSKKNVEE